MNLASTVKNKVSWGLIDPTDPSVGVALTYLSPVPDQSCPGNAARTFTIDFGCAKAPFPPPGQAPGSAHFAFIDEEDSCSYRAHSWSTAGCPLGACRRAWTEWAGAVRRRVELPADSRLTLPPVPALLRPECPVVGGALCGGNGVCGHDKSQNAVS